MMLYCTVDLPSMPPFNDFFFSDGEDTSTDVTLLSKTWLRNQKELLDCVAIGGCVTNFLHREVSKGRAMGAYLKDYIP